jgi:hypothetical protein
MPTDVSEELIKYHVGSQLLPGSIFALLILDPEAGDNTLFRNVGSHTDYTALITVFAARKK